MKVEPEWTGGQQEDGGCDRAGSGRAVMACYWRMERERGGERAASGTSFREDRGLLVGSFTS